MINYKTLRDDEKLDLLKVLYHEEKKKPDNNRSLEIIIAETQIVFKRIREGRH